MFNCLCRQAGFSVLPGCDVWFFSAHMKRLCCSVFVFFLSVWRFSFGNVVSFDRCARCS